MLGNPANILIWNFNSGEMLKTMLAMPCKNWNCYVTINSIAYGAQNGIFIKWLWNQGMHRQVTNLCRFRMPETLSHVCSPSRNGIAVLYCQLHVAKEPLWSDVKTCLLTCILQRGNTSFMNNGLNFKRNFFKTRCQSVVVLLTVRTVTQKALWWCSLSSLLTQSGGSIRQWSYLGTNGCRVSTATRAVPILSVVDRPSTVPDSDDYVQVCSQMTNRGTQMHQGSPDDLDGPARDF